MDWQANLKKKEMILVEWIDSSTENGWMPVAGIKIDDGKTILSIGYLLGKSKQFLIMAADIDLDSEIHNRLMQIPITTIKAVHRLNKGKAYGKFK